MLEVEYRVVDAVGPAADPREHQCSLDAVVSGVVRAKGDSVKGQAPLASRAWEQRRKGERLDAQWLGRGIMGPRERKKLVPHEGRGLIARHRQGGLMLPVTRPDVELILGDWTVVVRRTRIHSPSVKLAA